MLPAVVKSRTGCSKCMLHYITSEEPSNIRRVWRTGATGKTSSRFNRQDRPFQRDDSSSISIFTCNKHLCEDYQAASGYLCNSVVANKSKNTTRNISGVGFVSQVVLGEVTVVAGVVAWVVDADKVAKTIITSRNCLPGVIQQKNGDSSHMSRKNL